MNGRNQALALEAMRKAFEIRNSLKIGLSDPICIYDVAERLNLEVKFEDIPSMEGMYVKSEKPTIIISSLRPAGRQVFNCGHEIGHHVFKHGTRIDQFLADKPAKNYSDPTEFIADCFSGFLLMPKSTVSHAFSVRGWKPADCTPLQIYTIAGWFGVGYSTLITHMNSGLKMITETHAKELSALSLSRLRTMLLARELKQALLIVDFHWTQRAVDIQVDDFIYLPPDIEVQGQCIKIVEQDENKTLVTGLTSGQGRLIHSSSNWSAFVRVSRRNYVGRSVYRHLEECDD